MKRVIPFIILVFTFFLSTSILQAQVAINTDGSSPHASAMLHVKSNNSGLLIPRLTTTQRGTLGGIAQGGLMVYDKTLSKFYFHNGSGWVEASTGNLWSRTGSVTYTTNSTDDVGIGTSTPGYIPGSTRYLTVASGFGSTQVTALELKGGQYTTFSPVTKIDFLSHSGGGVQNVGRIESRITNSQNEGELLFYTNGGSLTEKMRIDEDGLVGIGTTSPKATLHVSDGNDGAIRIGNQSYWYGEFSYDYPNGDLRIQNGSTSAASGADIIFNTDGVDRAIINGIGEVGIGTLDPLGILHVHDNINTNAILYVTPQNTGSGDSATLFLAEDDGAAYGMYWMFDGSSSTGGELELWGKQLSNHHGPHMIIDRDDGYVAIGGIFANGYRLSVDGKIMCEEVRVAMSGDWPDYVFRKDYSLLPVEKLGDYIEEHGHLPNIPPATEIEESGLDVGEMQRLMMEKIEELSLYIVEQQKQIQKLKDQLNKENK